ncbi:MAG TPA: DUF4383 domain-containing protein [Woeseiaceae bacterium]|nr:DUF4383 domain-containing protein [Woeseiaceae bacterium]
MTVRYFALIYGIVFLVVGIAGFIPELVVPLEAEHPELAVETGAGKLFGLFPINLLHNIVHIVFGILGLFAWRSVSASVSYAKSVAVIYGLFVIMGLVPVLQTTFGLVPLYGHDIWLHILLAGVAAYFGFMARRDTGDAARV